MSAPQIEVIAGGWTISGGSASSILIDGDATVSVSNMLVARGGTP